MTHDEKIAAVQAQITMNSRVLLTYARELVELEDMERAAREKYTREQDPDARLSNEIAYAEFYIARLRGNRGIRTVVKNLQELERALETL
jgi:hypothetical protein